MLDNTSAAKEMIIPVIAAPRRRPPEKQADDAENETKEGEKRCGGRFDKLSDRHGGADGT